MKIYLGLVFGLLSVVMSAQDCMLNIGGKDKETIIEIFQLNEEQQTKLETWSAELAVKTKLIEDQSALLFKEHPQSNEQEMNTLATKYKAYQDQMVALSKEYDSKLLALFNERQYQRYVDLCKAAYLKPLVVSGE